MSILAELKRRKVVRVAVAYAAVAWVVAQVAEFAFETFEAPPWVLQVVVVLLILGLPIAIALAWAFEITPEGVKRDEGDQEATPAPARKASRLPIAATVIALMVVGGIAWFAFDWRKNSNEIIAARQQLVLAEELLQQDRYGEAYLLLQPVQALLEDDAEFARLMEATTLPVDLRIDMPDVSVQYRPYELPEAPWTDLGVTPLAENLRVPRGTVLARLSADGYLTREIAMANPGPMFDNVQEPLNSIIPYPYPTIKLTRVGELPEDMVLIPETDIPVSLSGYGFGTFGVGRREMPAFAIGKQEVSNQAYKEFVSAGGYNDPRYWDGIKLTDGTPLTEDHIATFVDSSGRPGPAGWDLGSFPPGEAELPVGGISMYEARAYARYRGLNLPTFHHWARAAYAPADVVVGPAAVVSHTGNFDAASPVRVDTEMSVGPWGTINMAGNMREWVWNTTEDLGFALGGAWLDYTGMYQAAYTLSPFDRSPQNGVRLMHNLGNRVDPQLLEPIVMNWAASEKAIEPVGDEAFEAMRFQFTHVRREPQHISRTVVQETDSWRAEEVVLSFNAEDQFVLYTLSPLTPKGRMQPVVYMPHSGPVRKMPNRAVLDFTDYLTFIPRSGRTLVIPIWKQTAQRYDPYPTADSPERADFARRVALAWYEDVATTIDYLESREDIDDEHLGFIGNSWGGYRSAVFLAIEKRFDAAVLIAGGAPYWPQAHPMYDPNNYFPRMTLPVLMINGRNDHLFLYENSQKRMFEQLGAPASDKKHIVYDSGHIDFPPNSVAREVSDFFDDYLGPLR